MKYSNASSQPSKKRKALFNSPLHLKQKLVSVHLGRELRKQTKKRSIAIRKGDKVLVLRGKYKKKEGLVSRVDLGTLKIFVEGITAKTQRGKEFPAGLNPAHLVALQLAERKKKAKAAPAQKAGSKEAKK
ncbi:MAG TPA: 50S ribosomal protein L24 [Candidatus Norongarragalinales archaeon]|nr:50S ribosomal protein L24 [Candidatus Norongarragalinales archaeon]